MSAYLHKEIRLLLPSCGVTVLMALFMWVIPMGDTQTFTPWVLLMVLPILFCPAVAVMTALDSFGREFSNNTFSNLLAQPMPRRQVWRTKVMLLAVALGVVFAAWWLSFLPNLQSRLASHPGELHDTFVFTVMFVITVFSGGLWTVLLLRQVGPAFWLTIIVPWALTILADYLSQKLGSHSERNVILVLSAYSVAGFIFARRLFLRAQDVQWTGGDIGLPAWLKLPRVFAPTVKLQGRRPRLSLLAKEFYLHQSQFLIAGALVLAHIGFLIARKVGSGFKDSPSMEFLANQFWVLWLVMPVLIGCAAVAEERKLGTLEASLCLPAKRRTQFAIKIGVVLTLAVFFGVVMPVLIESRGILPDAQAWFETMAGGQDDSPTKLFFREVLQGRLVYLLPVLPYVLLLAVAVGFAAIAFYVSTLTRNTLQAVPPAFLGIMIVWGMVMGAPHIEDISRHTLWRGGLIYLIGVPLLAVVLTALAWWNFKRVLVGWPVWQRNLLVLLVTLGSAMTLTTGIYQRAWEFLSPLEPVHGPARLAPKGSIRMSSQGGRLTVLLPDGRAWSAQMVASVGGPYEALTGNWSFWNLVGSGSFLAGTNWSDFAHCFRDDMALREDGTLWVSENPIQPPQDLKERKAVLPPLKLVRYDDATDWKQIVSGWTHLFALKSDGSLWRIGTNRWDWKSEAWPGLRAFEPQRIGRNNEWAEIFRSGRQNAFRTKDGRVYTPSYGNSRDQGETIQIDDGLLGQRNPLIEKTRWRAMVETYTRNSGPFVIGLTEQGRLCVAAHYELRNNSFELISSDIPLGHETNWVALARVHDRPVTLKADGTLWLWDFPAQSPLPWKSAHASRLGSRSDWLAVSGEWGSAISLAADGSLWLWRAEEIYGQEDFLPLLRPTRRPQLIGNIFSKAE